MTIYLGQIEGSIVLADGRQLNCVIELNSKQKYVAASIELRISESVLEIPGDEITIVLPDGRTGPFSISSAYLLRSMLDGSCQFQLECEQSPNWKGWNGPVTGEAIKVKA